MTKNIIDRKQGVGDKQKRTVAEQEIRNGKVKAKKQELEDSLALMLKEGVISKQQYVSFIFFLRKLFSFLSTYEFI